MNNNQFYSPEDAQSGGGNLASLYERMEGKIGADLVSLLLRLRKSNPAQMKTEFERENPRLSLREKEAIIAYFPELWEKKAEFLGGGTFKPSKDEIGTRTISSIDNPWTKKEKPLTKTELIRPLTPKLTALYVPEEKKDEYSPEIVLENKNYYDEPGKTLSLKSIIPTHSADKLTSTAALRVEKEIRTLASGGAKTSEFVDRIEQNRDLMNPGEPELIAKKFGINLKEYLVQEGKKASFLGTNVMNGIINFDNTLVETIDFFLPNELLGKFDFFEGIFNYYRDQGEKQKKRTAFVNDTTEKKIVGGLISSAVEAVPNLMTAAYSIAANGIQSTAKLAQTAAEMGKLVSGAQTIIQRYGRSPRFWISFAQGAGNAYKKQTANGASAPVATANALLNGLTDGAIELSGGVDTLSKEMGIKDKAIKTLYEGVETIGQGTTEGLWDKAIGSKTSKWFSLNSEEDAVFNPPKQLEQTIPSLVFDKAHKTFYEEDK